MQALHNIRNFTTRNTVSLAIFIACVLCQTSLEAAIPRKALEAAATAIGKSTDDVAGSMQQVLKGLPLDDVQWGKLTDDLAGAGKKGLSEADAMKRLQDINGLKQIDLTGELKTLRSVDRLVLVELLEQSSRVIGKGVKPEVLISAIQKGGPDAILNIRAMKSADGAADCAKGFEKFGADFANFARKGDDGAVQSLMKHSDELSSLKKADLDDILQNPAKYFDSAGKPLKKFNDLFPATRKAGKLGTKTIAAAAVVLYCFCPDSVFDVLEKILGKDIVDFLRNIQWYIRLFILGVVLWLCWPLLSIVFHFLRFIAMPVRRLLSKVPGKMGKWFASSLSADNEENKGGKVEKSPIPYYTFQRNQPICLGLLGSRRVGKSTFITMLNLKLQNLVPGAGLTAATGKDTENLKHIKEEVENGTPTDQKTEVSLKLTWPFAWKGGESAGHIQEKLCLMDYPGEHACAGYTSPEFKDLVKYLQKVDGLFVVIDPTNLELQSDGDRTKNQLAVIENMFNEDGLNLGHVFKRALTIIVTKRDAIDDGWLKKRRPEGMSDEQFARISHLAGKHALKKEESSELGLGIFDILYPNQFAKLKTILAPEAEGAHGVKQSVGSWIWPSRPESANIGIFAVSQLGFELGKQVSEARKKGIQKFDKPLNLESASTSEMDIHYPFQWMFNHIPSGLLNEINSRKAGWSFNPLKRWGLYSARRDTYKRFRGAEVIQQDRTVSWWRIGTLVVCTIMLFVLLGHLQRYFDRGTAYRELSGVVEQSNPDASAAEYVIAIEDSRRLGTKPYPQTLDTMQQLADKRKTMESYEAVFRGNNSDEVVRMGNMRSWLLDWTGLYKLSPSNSAVSKNEAPDIVDRYLVKEKIRMDSIASEYIHLLRSCCEKLCVQENEQAFEQAFATIKDCRNTLQQIELHPQISTGELDGLKNQINAIKEKTNDAYFAWKYKEVSSEIAKLLEVNNYSGAIQLIDAQIIAQLDSEHEIMEKARDYRLGILQDYWNYVNAQNNMDMDKNEFETPQARIEEFLRVTELGQFGAVAEKAKDGLLNRRVRFAIDQAGNLLNKDEPEESWKALDDVDSLYSRCNEPTQERWIDMAVKIKQRQGLYHHAINLLDRYPDKARGDAERNVLWSSWSQYVIDETPKLVNGGNCAKARNQFDWFRSANTTCPQDIKDVVADFEKKWRPIIEISESISLVKDEDAKDDAAFSSLLGYKSSISKIAPEMEVGKGLDLKWLEAVNDAFTARNESNAAIVYLNELKSDEYFSQTFSKRIDEMLKIHQANDFTALMTQARADFDAKKFGAARSLLLAKIRAKAPEVEIDRRKEWLRLAVDSFQAEDMYLEAIKFMEDVKSDQALGIPVDETLYNEVCEQFAKHTAVKFDDMIAKDRRTQAWTMIQREMGQDMPNVARDVFNGMVNQKINEAFRDLDIKISGYKTGSLFDKAREAIKAQENEFGVWTKIPDFNVGQKLRDRMKELVAEHHKHLIAVLKTNENFVQNFNEINLLLDDKALPEDERLSDANSKTLTAMRKELLENWEMGEYKNVYDVAKERKYALIAERAEKYLNNAHLREQRGSRQQEVENLLKWAKGLEVEKPYKLTGIRYKNFPKASLPNTSNYDPAFRVTVGDKSIEKDWSKNISGNGEITLEKTDPIKWKKGKPIVIEIYQEKIKQKYHIGTATIRSDYNLLDMANGGYIPAVAGKYIEDKVKSSGLAVGLIIEGLDQMPELPKHPKSK